MHQTLAKTYQGSSVGEEFPGFSLAALPVPSAELVQLVLTLRRGACFEQPGEEGLTSLLGTLMGRGCGPYKRQRFARECDSRGVEVEIYPGRDTFNIEITVLPEDLAWAVDILALMISEPRLEEGEVEIAKAEHLQQLAARADEQRLLLADRTRAAVFHQDHAYSRPLPGTSESLAATDAAVLSRFHQRLFLSDAPLHLCAAGQFELDWLKAKAREVFEPLCKGRGDGGLTARSDALFHPQPSRLVPVDFPFEQSRILIGLPAMARTASNYLEASFANEVFGGAFISRLTRAVRCKEGLAYSAGSRLWSAGQGGCLFMGLQTDHANVGKALKTIRVCMDQLLKEGLPAQELSQFKEFSLCSLPFDYDSLSSWCSRFLEHLLYGATWQPDERHEELQRRIEPVAISSVLSEMLQPQQATVCVLGRPQPAGVEEAFFASPVDSERTQFAVPELKPFPETIRSQQAPVNHTTVHQDEHGALIRYANGVHLLSLPRPELLSISLQVWTLTGSMDEPEGCSGMSHFLEHLMFRGTERFPDGDFDGILSQRGGLNNAFTSEDFTVYTDYVVMPGLEEALCLEADRFSNLRIEEEIFSTEKDVILEERSLRVDSNPLGKLYEMLQKAAFGDHPYGWPVLGWRQELVELKAEQLRAHYQKARHPARLMVVVAGGCTTDVASDLVARTLGAEVPATSNGTPSLWPATASPAPVPRLQSAGLQIEERSGYSYLVGCYRFPREGHPDFEAAELLSRVLGQGDSSRLHDKFVRQTQQALEVWLSYEAQTRDNPLLHIGMATAQPLRSDTFRQEVEAFLSGLAGQLTQAELDKAKRGWIAETAFGSDDLEEWAVEIAARVMLMSWDNVFSVRERVEAVTLDDLKRVATLYLAKDSAVFGRLDAL